MKNKKNIVLTVVSILSILILIAGATYAYFRAQTGDGSQTDVKINAHTVDTLMFETGNSLNLNLNQENFVSGNGNVVGSTFAKAMLTANNKTNTATETYNVFLNITDNNFKYTNSATYPEILLSIKDTNNNEITSINGLAYKTVTDGKGTSLSGFDITNQNGLITLLNNKEITTTSTKTDEWIITITFVNYDFNQSENAGKSFSGQILITKDTYNNYIPNTINTLKASKNDNKLTVSLNLEEGSNKVDKYYFAIEEKNNLAMVNRFTTKKLANNLYDNNLTFVESNSSSYTFTNIDNTKNYSVYAYAVDKKNVKTNMYEYKIYSGDYVYPSISNVDLKTTSSTVTATVTGINGTNNISKYYYSIDSGNTYVESTNNSYTFTGLENGTYKMFVKVLDTYGKYSNVYVKNIIIDELIKFTFEGSSYYAKSGMTLRDWINSGYNTWGYNTIDDNLLTKVLKNDDIIKIYHDSNDVEYVSSLTPEASLLPFTEINFKNMSDYSIVPNEALDKLKALYKHDLSEFNNYQNASTDVKDNREEILESLESSKVFYYPFIFKIVDASFEENADGRYEVLINVPFIGNVESIKFLIYDISTNLFEIVEPISIDGDDNSVSVALPDNVIFTFLGNEY